MDSIKWTEKSISFRSLVDNSAVQKPALGREAIWVERSDCISDLVQIGNKLIIVGEKIKGEFIMASPVKVSGDRFDAVDNEIVLSSKHPGLLCVIETLMTDDACVLRHLESALQVNVEERRLYSSFNDQRHRVDP